MVPVAVAVTAAWIWSWPLGVSDRLTAIGDAIGGGALVLGLSGGVVAYLAYLTTLSRPRLVLEVAFPNCGPQHPQFVTRPEAPGRASEGVVQVHVWITNTSDFPARNPEVRVWFDPNVFAFPLGRERDWKRVGLMRLDWSSAAPLHAHGARTDLPLLEMSEHARASDRITVLRIELYADGYGSRWLVPVHLVNESEAAALRLRTADYRPVRAFPRPGFRDTSVRFVLNAPEARPPSPPSE